MFGIRMDQAVTRGRSPNKMIAIAAVIAWEKSQGSQMSGKLRAVMAAMFHQRLTGAWDWGGVQINGIASIVSDWDKAPDCWVAGCEAFVRFRLEDAKAIVRGDDISVPNVEKCKFGAGKPNTSEASTSTYLHSYETVSYTANENDVTEAEEFIKAVEDAGGLEKYAATIKW